ncbi:MAG: zinc ribbon domain-containing protein [Anaerolineae bacterium]|nr:zinc ribbon domain-containing protein [Anaerolineae bacterium]
MADLKPEDLLLFAAVYLGVVAAVFWLAMIIWAYRDMRSRSRDSVAQILVAVVVAFLFVPGLLIYIFLRPRETLAEAYERSLEEEALLQEIEDKTSCPACGQHVHDNWLACPYCHTRLKKSCINCGQSLELSWNLCPYCTASQISQPEPVANTYAAQQRWQEEVNYNSQPVSQQASESLEFIDGDEYQ